MSYEVAKDFWVNKSRYPNFPDTKQRRLYDLNFVMSHTGGMESVMDIGCADGYLLVLLRELTNIEKFYAYDINEHLLNKLEERWGMDTVLHTKVWDLTEKTSFVPVDLTLCMGLLPSIFDLQHVNNLLSNISSDTMIVRAPCTLKDEDEYINKYSEDLKCNYSSIYRTVTSYTTILSRYYDNIKYERSYPDEIESKFGTKHYYFVCKKGE